MFDEKQPRENGGAHNEPSAEPQGAAASPETTDNPAMELPEIPAPAAAAPTEPAAPERESAPRRSFWTMFGAAVALVALSAGISSATTWTMARKYNEATATPIGYTVQQSGGAKVVSAGPIAAGDANVIPAVYRRVSASVVKVTVQTARGARTTSAGATGSGFVVDPRGYILTNHHVIENAAKVEISFVDGTKLEGKVVGKDRSRDLAVVQVNPGNRSLVAAPLGNSDNVQVGELAIAIGSPFGQDFTVTAGIVSALERSIEEENNPFPIPGAIQTDASINPGNSGGPLLNGNGEVIGINTAIEGPVRGSVGIGFAVPINLAKEILPTLIAGQEVKYPWLGVSMETLTDTAAGQIQTTVKKGVVVMDVYKDSPAAKAGIKSAGTTRSGVIVSADVVTEIDGKPITTPDEVRNYIATKRPGDSINITVVRGKETLKLTTQLSARPDQPTLVGEE